MSIASRMPEFRALLAKFQEHERLRSMDELDALAPIPITRAHTQKRKRTCLGDLRLANIRRLLDEFGLERSKMQKEFHESFLRAVCLHLYRDDVDVDYTKIMRDNNWR